MRRPLRPGIIVLPQPSIRVPRVLRQHGIPNCVAVDVAVAVTFVVAIAEPERQPQRRSVGKSKREPEREPQRDHQAADGRRSSDNGAEQQPERLAFGEPISLAVHVAFGKPQRDPVSISVYIAVRVALKPILRAQREPVHVAFAVAERVAVGVALVEPVGEPVGGSDSLPNCAHQGTDRCDGLYRRTDRFSFVVAVDEPIIDAVSVPQCQSEQLSDRLRGLRNASNVQNCRNVGSMLPRQQWGFLVLLQQPSLRQ